MTDESKERPTTLYELLGVSRDATEAEIQSAFRELALDHHPDVNGGADAETMKVLNHARETLLDDEKRAAYDAKLEQLDISPWDKGSADPNPVQQRVAPREGEMSYMMGDDWIAAERTLPSVPFDDPVANVALQSWAVRAVLVVVVVLGGGWLNGAGLPGRPPGPGLSALFLGVVGAFGVDALRTLARVPQLDGERMRVDVANLTTPVVLAIIGAALWTGSVHVGGAPGAFIASLVLPLAAVGLTVAAASWLLGMGGTYAIVHGAIWGVTVALPFASAESTFLPPTALPVASPADVLLSSGLGGGALFCVFVGGTVGGSRLSRWAWELRYRGGRAVIPQAWELALVTAPLLGGLFFLSTNEATRDSAAQYGVVLPPVEVAPEVLGLGLVWTVPTVWCGLLARERVARAIHDGDR